MLKKDDRVRIKGEKKPPVNRKLLFWVFILTGILSLLLWWRGKTLRDGAGLPEDRQADLTFVLDPKAASPTEGAEQKDPQEVIRAIEELTATASGRYAVFVYHPKEKRGYGINEQEVKPGASTLKLPVVITAIKRIEKGELKFDDKFTLEDADRVPGSGPLQFKKAGTVYSIDELLTYLGQNSDNTAWVLFNRRWGKAAMQRTMDELGMADSNYEKLLTTAADVAKMWDYLYGGKMSAASRQAVWRYLTGSIYEDRIPAGLVGTGAEVVGHKVGTDIDVWADSGIIKGASGEFIVVILNEGVKRDEATQLVPGIVKLIWKFESEV